MHSAQYVDGPYGTKLAYRPVPGRAPCVVFLGGFRSDMTGSKAPHLSQWARCTGQAYLRFDFITLPLDATGKSGRG